MMIVLAFWILQNYFTAQLYRVRTYFVLTREKPNQDQLSGVPHYHSSYLNYSLPMAGSWQEFPDTIIVLSNSF